MTEQQLKSLQEKGFSIEKLNKLVSLQFLLVTILETQVLDVQEYLKEFNLSLQYSNDIETLKRNIKFFKDKIKSEIVKDKVNDYFNDYEKLSELINKLSKLE